MNGCLQSGKAEEVTVRELVFNKYHSSVKLYLVQIKFQWLKGLLIQQSLDIFYSFIQQEGCDPYTQ